jgi:hypothetical protein
MIDAQWANHPGWNSRLEYFYDDYGNLMKSITGYDDLKFTTKHIYNEDGLLSIDSAFTQNGLYYTSNYSYEFFNDRDGLGIRRTNNCTDSSITVLTFVLDKSGIWVKQLEVRDESIIMDESRKIHFR